MNNLKNTPEMYSIKPKDANTNTDSVNRDREKKMKIKVIEGVCPDCLCHYFGSHTCDGMMKALVEYQKSKPRQNHPNLCKHTWVYICVDCGETVAPLVVPSAIRKEPKPVPGRTNPLSPDYPHY